ncbi:hypothetical protein MTO96_023127 [Rhipicephalus appendiculatus]
MIAFACLGHLAFLTVAAGFIQRPTLTKCDVTDNSIVQVESVTVKNAKLGQRIRIDAKSRVYKTTNLEPVAEISVTTSSGTPLPCVYSAMPKQLKTCGWRYAGREDSNLQSGAIVAQSNLACTLPTSRSSYLTALRPGRVLG